MECGVIVDAGCEHEPRRSDPVVDCRTEIKEGAQTLLEKIRKYRPKIAVFNGKGIYEIFCGHKNFYIGRQPEAFPGTNTEIFVMPSSSARCSQLPRAIDKLPFYVALRKLRDHLCGRLHSLDPSELIFPDLNLKVEPKKERVKEEDVNLSEPPRQRQKRITVEPKNEPELGQGKLPVKAQRKNRVKVKPAEEQVKGRRRRKVKVEFGQEVNGVKAGVLSMPVTESFGPTATVSNGLWKNSALQLENTCWNGGTHLEGAQWSASNPSVERDQCCGNEQVDKAWSTAGTSNMLLDKRWTGNFQSLQTTDPQHCQLSAGLPQSGLPCPGGVGVLDGMKQELACDLSWYGYMPSNSTNSGELLHSSPYH